MSVLAAVTSVALSSRGPLAAAAEVEHIWDRQPVVFGAIVLALVFLAFGLFMKIVRLILFAGILCALGIGVWIANSQGWFSAL